MAYLKAQQRWMVCGVLLCPPAQLAKMPHVEIWAQSGYQVEISRSSVHISAKRSTPKQ
jgi:hypothetical protein